MMMSLRLCSCGLALMVSIGTALKAQDDKPLNVVFIGIDDMRVETKSYGYDHMITPHIDRLAEMGLQFNRAYVQQAICAASRASLLTGCRPNTTTVNYPYNDYFTEEFLKTHQSIPDYYSSAGYYTRTLGKMHHGYKEPNITEKHYKSGALLYPHRPELLKPELSSWRDTVAPYAHPDMPENEFQDGRIADETIATIRRAVASGRPFFIAPGFQKPHLPYVCPKEYYDLYDNAQIALSPHPVIDQTQDPISVPVGGGAHKWNNYMSTGISDAEAKELKHHYLACISFIDAQVGKILDELERLDLMDNTVIMLWSDHGYHLGDHGIWTKQTNYELGTRSPLMVYYPGMTTGGQQTNALVEYVDMYPTLLDLCGLEIPEWIEGLSMEPLLRDPRRSWKRAAFSQYPRGADVEGYSIRTSKYRYTEWRDEKQEVILHRELYDHTVDSLETLNLAEDPDYQEILQEHQQILQEGWEAALPETLSSKERGPGKPDEVHEGVSVYPNPCTDMISVKSDNLISEISIVGIDGRMIRHFLFQGGNKVKVDVQDLPAGIYSLKTENGHTGAYTRFIKM